MRPEAWTAGFRLPGVADEVPRLASRATAQRTRTPAPCPPAGRVFPLRSSWPRAWPGGAYNRPALDQLKELAGVARSELGEGRQLRIQHLRRGRQRVSPRGTSERGVTPECQPGAKPQGCTANPPPDRVIYGVIISANQTGNTSADYPYNESARLRAAVGWSRGRMQIVLYVRHLLRVSRCS